MAVSSLWHISGRLRDVIAYVENPDKTVPKGMEDFFNVFSYVKRPEATADGAYVTAINCLRETALQQMILTKKQFGKEDKYIAWHGYQSFRIGEIDGDTAHEIGIRLAKEMWGDRFQIVVTTHLDKAHIHNHFCFNSVSFRDGKKYNYSKSELQRLRDCNDRLCREYGLSVIEKPGKAPSRPVWMDEKAGKPTRYQIYREDIEAAASNSNSVQKFELFLRRRGYEVDLSGMHWKLRLPQYQGFTRMDTLDPQWTPAFLAEEMRRTYHSFGNLPGWVTYRAKTTPRELWSAYIPHQKTGKIYRLYLYYCYQLGVYPKGTTYRPDSPQLKQDLRYLDQLTEQVDYMAAFRIETMEDLYADRSRVQEDLDRLIRKRTKIQNRIRRAEPEEKAQLRLEKSQVTDQILSLRKRVKCSLAIEERSERIQNQLDLVYENELQHQRVKERSRDAR